MIYRNEDIYPHIVLIDEVAYLERAAEPISVADIVAELAEVRASKVGRRITAEAIIGVVARKHGVTVEQVKGAESFARDAWCTPEPLAKLLPPRDRLMDPCSNPRSFVDAEIRCMLEQGRNGQTEPWQKLVYVNAGFSDLMPWVVKLRAEKERSRAALVEIHYSSTGRRVPAAYPLAGCLEGACFMVNTDNSTQWWQALTDALPCLLHLDRRQPFVPHPGVAKSTNNKPQSLIGDRAFFEACDPKIFELGRMYEQTKSRRVA